jgi:mannose-6-phosphate isomerase-like protein (cupin superfamily)
MRSLKRLRRRPSPPPARSFTRARMSMITEDLPPNSAIRVHLHQHEDEIIVIRMGSGIAALGDREVAVTAGAIVYVPQGVWHGLRANGTDTLGMTAIYSPPGFEQAFKDRLLHPNRTPAEAERHGRGWESSIGIRRSQGVVTWVDRPRRAQRSGWPQAISSSTARTCASIVTPPSRV